MLNLEFLTEDQLVEIQRAQLGLWILLNIVDEEVTTRGGIFSATTLLSFFNIDK